MHCCLYVSIRKFLSPLIFPFPLCQTSKAGLELFEQQEAQERMFTVGRTTIIIRLPKEAVLSCIYAHMYTRVSPYGRHLYIHISQSNYGNLSLGVLGHLKPLFSRPSKGSNMLCLGFEVQQHQTPLSAWL